MSFANIASTCSVSEDQTRFIGSIYSSILFRYRITPEDLGKCSSFFSRLLHEEVDQIPQDLSTMTSKIKYDALVVLCLAIARRDLHLVGDIVTGFPQTLQKGRVLKELVGIVPNHLLLDLLVDHFSKTSRGGSQNPKRREL